MEGLKALNIEHPSFIVIEITKEEAILLEKVNYNMLYFGFHDVEQLHLKFQSNYL